MNLIVATVAYQSMAIKMVITEETEMYDLGNRGFTVPNEDEKESFGEYVVRKKRAREIKRIQDERKKKDKERTGSFSFEDFVMDYFD
jgi:hypothetical protein